MDPAPCRRPTRPWRSTRRRRPPSGRPPRPTRPRAGNAATPSGRRRVGRRGPGVVRYWSPSAPSPDRPCRGRDTGETGAGSTRFPRD
ncbi:hypothetical protein E4P36_30210 [Streptomyces sp. 4R-3d]|nr:hypothetical protein E4P36_30210 [Streptomyces sp. 4R-3d]